MLSLKKGTIHICDERGAAKTSVGFTFNPSAYTIRSTPLYQTVKKLGQDNTGSVFISGAARELSAVLYFDSASDSDLLPLFLTPELSRALPMATLENQLKPVTDKTKLLAEAVRVAGEQHTPPTVIFSWGNLNFKGKISSLSEEYTMFSMEGKPIRAKVNITIKEETDEALMRKTSPFESPDRTKSRVIVEGMSLWSLAYEEYDDCEKWRIIARANHIMNPLDVVPGQVVKIPALEQE